MTESLSSTIEGKTMQSLVDSFCKEWCSKKSELNEMRDEVINLIAEVQTVYIVGSIKSGDMMGSNLHSEYTTLLDEIRELKDQVKFMRDNEETLKLAMEKGTKELREQLDKSKGTKTKTDYGVFSSKTAKDFADENGINGNDIEGTGKGNKVTKKDIQKHINGTSASKKKTKTDSKKPKKFCNGAKDDGSPCKNSGSLLIKGKWYCKKHKSQAINEDLQEEEEEEFSDYDEEKDNILKENPFDESLSEENPFEDDPLTRFRKESLKSIDTMSNEDEHLNSVIGGCENEWDEENEDELSD